MTDRITAATTLGELEAIMNRLGASIAVDLAGGSGGKTRHLVLVTLTCADAAAAGSANTVHDAIDRAIWRLGEARSLHAARMSAAGSITPDQAAKLVGNLTPDQSATIRQVFDAELSVDCKEFLCLPERNPSHYVGKRHLPIRGRGQ